MAAVQLNFSLRTSTNVKTVHLLGSWDNYAGQLPLAKDKGKAGSWKGTFRFQGATLQCGQRYWYYYVMDGYHVSHDPAQAFTTEPTTGRKLNILDIPSGPSQTSSSAGSKRDSKHIKRQSAADIAQGRGLSPSRIVHPLPQKPYASRQVREFDYGASAPVDELTQRFADTNFDDDEDDDDDDDDSELDSEPPSSAGSSVSSRSSPSSLSSVSSGSECRCERYGITRKGDRVKLDCGGSRCGYSSESSDGSESDCSSEEETYRTAVKQSRRQGIVVRR